jgi:hypothetical protein
MTARATARRLVLQAALVVPCAAGLCLLSPACYPSGAEGTDPPTTTFYFPVGLAVSPGGNVLYVANSDFDLQWNGGTIQSYDLFRLRHDTAELIGANFLTQGANADSLVAGNGQAFAKACVTNRLNADIPFLGTIGLKNWAPLCQSQLNPVQVNGMRLPLGEACSPPVQSAKYNRASAIIGAFATDLQLSLDTTRLFSPIRGNGTVTWADVLPDNADSVPPGEPGAADAGAEAGTGCAVAGDAGGGNAPAEDAGEAGAGAGDAGEVDAGAGDAGPSANWPDGGVNTPDPFHFNCGQAGTQRCDGNHQTGAVATAADTRNVTLPGEPFAMAQTEDGTAVAVTHQTSPQTSVLLTGLPACIEQGSACVAPASLTAQDPSMQFVLTGVPIGGDGLAPVPHDPDGSIPPCELPTVNYHTPCVRPAFLETTHSAAELDLLRYYNDDGSSLLRPFLVREAAYTLNVNSGGTDSRGIVIDDTPRRACKAKALPGADLTQCAQLPARVFFASRTPPSLVIGEIGEYNTDGSYNPDQLKINSNVTLQPGASRVYLAPIVDASGRYALRVFVVCFDSNEIFVYDPDAGVIENVISTGPGPFAMAFDPFSLDDVAQRILVPGDTRQHDSDLKMNSGIDVSPAGNGPASLKRYRFAYLASFTDSYLQVIDLDDSVFEPCPVPGLPTESCNVTFERPVFTLGQPTLPKGS